DHVRAACLEHGLCAAPLERAELVLVLPFQPDAVGERLQRRHACSAAACGRASHVRTPYAARPTPSATRPTSRIHAEPGTFSSFSPLSVRMVPSAMRRTMSGVRTVKRLVISTPG